MDDLAVGRPCMYIHTHAHTLHAHIIFPAFYYPILSYPLSNAMMAIVESVWTRYYSALNCARLSASQPVV